MTNYARLYRFGITPWERYGTVAAASFTALLDREETERSPFGRALDLGCGRGQYTPELARRGWQAVGIDYVPATIEAAAAKSWGVDGLSYVVGDVPRLPLAHLGNSTSSSISAASRVWTPDSVSPGGRCLCACQPRGTLLLLSFGPTRWQPLVGGASQGKVETTFEGSEMLAVESADTAGLGWADEQDRAAVVQAAPTDLAAKHRMIARRRAVH